MSKKQVGLILATAVVFGILGIVVGQFVTLPGYQAVGDEGDQSLFGPLWGIADYQRNPMVLANLKVNHLDSNPFTACPGTMKPTTTLPFYLKQEDVSLSRDTLENFVDGPGILKKINPKTYIYGRKKVYEAVTEYPKVIARPVEYRFRVKTVSRVVDSSDGNPNFDPNRMVLHLEKDLVGALADGPELNIGALNDIVLCEDLSAGEGPPS